jgi:hypothetical protein
MESSFLSFWQSGMMHVDLVLYPSCVRGKVGMNQNATAIRSNGLCRGLGAVIPMTACSNVEFVSLFIILLLCY